MILALTRYGTGFVDSASVLLGIVVGRWSRPLFGLVDFAQVATASWFDVVLPFHFGLPTFDLVSIMTMCIVMIVVMIESTGMFLALGEITAEPVDEARLTGACAPTASAP